MRRLLAIGFLLGTSLFAGQLVLNPVFCEKPVEAAIFGKEKELHASSFSIHGDSYPHRIKGSYRVGVSAVIEGKHLDLLFDVATKVSQAKGACEILSVKELERRGPNPTEEVSIADFEVSQLSLPEREKYYARKAHEHRNGNFTVPSSCDKPIRAALERTGKQLGLQDPDVLNSWFTPEKDKSYLIPIAANVKAGYYTINFKVRTKTSKNKKTCTVTSVDEVERLPR